ncbi:hypothetical protein LPMP_321000 [Leishmania panamensis]|uniref:TOG domain-containing protein n=1 Tax=Leishmania panamensis TaxID=5679 RepID=A0A088SGP7_LEIPA|nr:hypothetical protein LPMP_321000 [Leishmania panamensis]AIO00987.1 hypothetical protein LPMP_321000 [Leishmania panamensis]
MARTSSVALTDEEVLRRVQVLSDALAEEQRQTKVAIDLRKPLRDWHVQIRLLEEVARLLADDISDRLAFVGWMSLYMRNCLLHSMQSRRTRIAVAAVNVLESLVQHGANRAAVAVVCSWFLPCLVRLAANPSAVSVVSAAAMHALLSVAEKCMLTLDSVSGLLCDCGASSAAVRRCSVEVLRSYLQAAKGTSIQLSINAYTKAIHRVISDRMRDADAGVRHAARRCFWALHILEPASTGALLRLLPAGLQRQLAAERADAMQELQAVVSSPVPPTSSLSAPRCGSSVHLHPRGTDATPASRTVTLKDDLQSAVASRARVLAVRATTPRKARHQLLRSAKQAVLHQEADAGRLPTPYLSPPRGRTVTMNTVSPRLYAVSHRSGGDTSLLTSMESTDWAVRRTAVLQGQRLCESGTLTSEDIAHLLEGLLSRLRDIHFRVVEGAQNCLLTLVARAPTATQNEFRSLLPFLVSALVRNTSHARPAVCVGARYLLDHIVRTHEPPQEVLKAVLRAADDVVSGGVTMNQRYAELLHYLMTVRPSLFAEVSTMGIAVRGVLAHLHALEMPQSKGNHRPGDRAAQTSWCSALGAVLLACPGSFRQIAERLAPSEQEEVRTALRKGFGLMDRHWEEQLSDIFEGGKRWLRCPFAEELMACRMTKWDVTGTGKLLSGADDRTIRDGDVSGVTSLRSSTLQNASTQLREFLSSNGACLLSAEAVSALPEDAGPVVPSQLAQPAIATRMPWTARASADASEGYGDVPAPVPQCALPAAERSRDAVACFLRQRPQCRGAEERRRALLSLAEALRADSATGERVAILHRLNCVPEEVVRLLMHWERELSDVEREMHHSVRWAILMTLQELLQWPAARSSVARQLTRVLGICRAGLDDPFVEVQLQATTCLDTLLTASKLPADLCLNAISSCVMRWLEGPMGDAATSGWLVLVHMIIRVVEQAQLTLAGEKDTNGIGSVGLPGEPGCPQSAALTAPVLHRVVATLKRCLTHCHVSVRLCAVLVLVGIRRLLGDTVTLPFLAPLSTVHMRLIDVYLGKGMEKCP